MAKGKKEERPYDAEPETAAAAKAVEDEPSTVVPAVIAPPADPSQYPPDEELPLPRVSIIQAMSDAATSGTHKPGLFLNNLTDEDFSIINGVILGMGLSRAYGISRGKPPLCRSLDYVNGEGDPGGICADCKHSQWDREKTPNVPPVCNGNYDFVIVDDTEMPFIFTVRSKGIQPAKQFIGAAKAKGLPLFCFNAEITIREDTNEYGKFFIPHFAVKGQTNHTTWPALSELATRLLAAMRRVQATEEPKDTANGAPAAEY